LPKLPGLAALARSRDFPGARTVLIGRSICGVDSDSHFCAFRKGWTESAERRDDMDRVAWAN